MRNYLKEYFEIREKIRENKLLFEHIESYLMPGIYYSNFTGNIIVNSNNSKMVLPNTFDSLTASDNLFALFLKDEILRNKMIVEDKNQISFFGSFVIITSSRGEYKIFSEEEVLTVYTDSAKFLNIIRTRDKFSEYFNVPEIVLVDYANFYVKEKRISKTEFDVRESLAIFESYIPFMKSEKCMLIEDWDVKAKSFELRYGVAVNVDVLKCLPQIYTHGDLWSENIMYDGKVYYLTDYESAGYRYFLYDLFMYIFSEYFIKNNDCLLKMYFNGSLDKLFEAIFEGFSLIYEVAFRKEYFLGFLICIYDERWKNSKSIGLHFKLKRFIRYIELEMNDA